METPRSVVTGSLDAERAPRAAWLFVALLWLCSAAAGPFGAPYLDSVRDTYGAWQIASGSALPLVGPEIGFFTHLGPAWYYLLAPGALFGGYAAVALWAGVLQGSQFALALLLGERLGSWRTGVILAALLAMPGLDAFSYHSFNHFNLVPAAVLALALCALADRSKPSARSAFALGLVFSLALHAHPSTVALGWVPALLWLFAACRWKRLASMAAGGLLPFAPLIWAGLRGQIPETPTAGVGQHLAEHLSWSAAAAVPELLWHTLVGGTRHGLVLATHGTATVLWVLAAGLFALVALAPAGLAAAWRNRTARALLLACAAGLVVHACAVLLMRAQTQWYLMLAVTTLAKIVVAVPLGAVGPALRDRLVLPLAAALAALSMGSLLVMLVGTADNAGMRHFPAAFMMDLQAGANAGRTQPGPQLTFVGADRFAKRLCRQRGPVVLHGAAAQQADLLTRLMAALHCPDDFPRVRIGGRSEPASTRWLAVGPTLAPFVPRRGPAPEPIESLQFVEPARVHFPPESEPLADAADYPPRQRLPATRDVVEIEFSTGSGDLVLLSNPYPWWSGLEVLEVTAGGRPQQPLARDMVGRLFACDACAADEPVQWRIRLRMPGAQRPDIVSVER